MPLNNVILTTNQVSNFTQYNNVAEDANNIDGVPHPQYESAIVFPGKAANLGFYSIGTPNACGYWLGHGVSPFYDDRWNVLTFGTVKALENYPNGDYIMASIVRDMASLKGTIRTASKAKVRFRFATDPDTGTPFDAMSHYSVVIRRKIYSLDMTLNSSVTLATLTVGGVSEIDDDFTADFHEERFIVYEATVIVSAPVTTACNRVFTFENFTVRYHG